MTARDAKLTHLAELWPEYSEHTPEDLAVISQAIGYLWRVLGHALGEPALTDPENLRAIFMPLVDAESDAATAWDQAAGMFHLYSERGTTKLDHLAVNPGEENTAAVAEAADRAARLATFAASASLGAHVQMYEALDQVVGLSLRPAKAE
ncbi:hypothetical protein D7D52_36040 [Nocardia yunnanensis]|uniref:Uncharacterized protein n=1 Tax=Nocardia yunnanensis TaxID=2382165 RepID=A0A386ZL99_9NOCA|nr:hypothetical protein [Nocardia yunnanensis]AYF78351.1 hypothetical protein D7D52_36040 [Nocardia yunnanensis]